jgi:Tfp pilus assembly protein PilX
MTVRNITKRKLKGSVLGFSILLLSLFLFSGITLVSVSVLERKASFSTQKSVIAFQAADSAAERVLKRIYIDNSPLIALVALNGTMPSDGTLNTLASNLSDVSGPGCTSGVIGATNSPAASSPDYTFQVSFYDTTGGIIACGDNQWRDKVIRIRSEGFYQRTSRVIEIGIRPRI